VQVSKLATNADVEAERAASKKAFDTLHHMVER